MEIANSISLVYAMHGAVVLFVTLNWERLRFAVPYLAGLHVLQGCAIFAIGLDAGLPWWWVAVEGPSVVAFALVLLAVYRRTRESGARESVRESGIGNQGSGVGE